MRIFVDVTGLLAILPWSYCYLPFVFQRSDILLKIQTVFDENDCESALYTELYN